MKQEIMNKEIFLTTIAFIFVVVLFQFTNFDIAFQSLFYNFETKEWILSKNEAIFDLIFYSGFKKLFIFFALVTITITILVYFKKINFLQEYKKGLLIISLASIFVPSLASLKNITNVPCPVDIVNFGGNSPDIKILDSYPKEYVQEKKAKCWPAGHATMGFSLMSLYFFFKNSRNKKIALTFAIFIGFSTGGYKILIGDHFLSHTLVTMLLAWLVILLIAKFILKEKDEKSTKI